MTSQCGNMSYVSAKPDQDLLVAGIALLGLWSSTDGGGSWQPLGASSDASASITNRTSAIVYDPQTTTRFWESGIYNSNGVYETSDDGQTFVALGDVTHSDGVSIDFTDPMRQTMLAGGHEQSQTLNRSTDGGNTWTAVGGSLPPNTNCVYPLVIDGQTHLVGCGGYGGGVTGIYRTTDGATTWKSVSSLGGSELPLVASDGSIYWSSPEGAGMARSTDQGQMWNMVVGSAVVGSFHPVELPDGRIATIGPAAQYGPQYVIASADQGANWTRLTSALPYSDAVGLTYSSQRNTFYIWHFTCGSNAVPVPADAIMAYDLDDTTG